MQISDKGLELIKSFEGFHDRLPDGSCRAYLDKLAKPHIWTIGWGCTEGVTEGMVWTREEAEQGLRREIAKHEAHVLRLVQVELNQNEFDALTSFCYNLGPGNLGKSTLLRKLNKGDRRGAAKEFRRWNQAGGKVWLGLVDRRAREATLFLTPVDEPAAPRMPQRVEPSPAPPPPAVDATAKLGTGGIATQIPVPPDLSPYTAWQSFTETAVGLGTWAIAAPWKLGLVAVVVGAIGWGLPWLSRRAQQ